MRVSAEYREFLEQIKPKKPSLYERACILAERILPIKPWKELNQKYQSAIEFTHMQITPRAAFSLAILATILTFILPLLIFLTFGAFSLSVLMLIMVFTSLVFYFLYDYPTHYATVFRIKASAEMVLAIVYMTISIQVTPNLENAIRFAAKNLTGPLAEDLRRLLWDVYMRKYDTVTEALDSFIKKWKVENREFTEAIYLIKTSMTERTKRREEVLNEAISVMLNGTKERMKHYAQELKTPITILNALGILLPIIGIVFFPMVAIFLPNVVRPVFLVVGYNVLLPISVYWLMKSYLEKRPYSFHQPDISRHPKFRKPRTLQYTAISIAIALPLILFGLYKVVSIKDVFSIELMLFSLMITIGIAGGIITFSIISVYNKIKLRNEIASIESEFTEALFQLGYQLRRGIPLESALEAITLRIKQLKIAKLFEKILYNIKTFGMTFEQAVFDKDMGAMREYPSVLIQAVMRAITEISKRGMVTVSKSMITISNYLKDVHDVEEDLRELLGEVTSTMQMQALLLAPLSAGIVVALAAIIMKMLISLKSVVESIYGQFAEAGPLGLAGGSIFDSFVNINKMIPVHHFQLIVSIYMLEVVGLLAIFLSLIKNGDEELLRRLTIAKMLLLALVIYSITLVLSYSMFISLIPLTGIGGLG